MPRTNTAMGAWCQAALLGAVAVALAWLQGLAIHIVPRAQLLAQCHHVAHIKPRLG